jgi:zinc protease
MSEVEQRHGALPAGEPQRTPGPPEPARSGFRYRELAGEITQTHFALGWRTPGTLDPATTDLELASMVLGAGRASRLYRAVRERSLAASVHAYDYTPTELGVFVVQADGPPDRAVEAARAVWQETQALRELGVGRDELWRARRLVESRWIRRLETMEGQANHLAEWEALGDWTLGDRYLERLLTAEPAQVTETVRRCLTPERAALCLYHPRNGTIADGPDAMREMLEAGARQPLPASPPRQAVALAAGIAATTPVREHGRIRIYDTARGVPVLVRHKAGAPLVHLGVFAVGGATEEDADLAGLTALMARTSIKGTTRRTADQIAEDAELLGGSIGTSVGSESFGWTLSVPADYADAALELLADVVQHATFPDAALGTERTLALADLALLRDDMYRWPLRLLTRAAFGGHPYGIPASGTEESLPRIGAADVRDWHRRHVLDAPLVIAAVGEVDADRLASRAASFFGELRMSPPARLRAPGWPNGGTELVESREKAQSAIALAFPAPSRTDPARFAAHLLAGIASGLGGRFFEELRDKRSLAYTVSAFPSERRLAGIFAAYIATSPNREQEAIDGLLHEFARFRAAPPDEDELARAKEYAVGTHAIRQQSGAGVLGDLLDAWMFGALEELDEFEARVRAVTPDDLLALARRYFVEESVVRAIVRGVGKVV